MQKKIKVCLVSPAPPPYGGIANWTRIILENFKDEEIELFHYNSSIKKRHKNLIVDRIIKSGIKMIKDNREITKMIDRENIDIVHFTTSGSLGLIRDYLLLKKCRKMNIPTVYHLRIGRFEQIEKKNNLEWKIFKRCFKLANKIMVIDMSSYDIIHKHFSNVVRVPNISEKILLHNEYQKENSIIYLGDVSEIKGITTLITAWEKLNFKKDWKLKLIGLYTQKYYAYLEKKFDLSNVEFMGLLGHNEALKQMNECSIFVFPSKQEGFPNAVAEAMQLGMPILATKVGAIPEMLDDNAGILIDVDNLEQLIEGLKLLTSDEKLRIKLSENAKCRAENEFSYSVIESKLKAVWKEVNYDK